MRIFFFGISLLITIALVVILNRPLGEKVPMPLGAFLSPQHGFWQNAKAADEDFNEDISLPQLKGNATVYFDDRLIPHVFADNDEDLYFVQGFLHAKFRLFQMDLQTKAAEGRASEIAGPKAIRYDREQRRLGMKFAAERALKEMEKNPVSFAAFAAYTKGVNAYIHSLKEKDLPLEYKLLNFKPEEWSNLRTALLLKMMAKMLASGTEYDLEYTNAKNIFSKRQLEMIYPQIEDSLLPIIPKGTVFDKPAIVPVKPITADSLYFQYKDTISAREVSKPDIDNGSNNWVVAGSKSASGKPILCNDPHLELSLPSIWYEMQLTGPASSVYGVTLPGSPFVIIGFNQNISWGVTNAERDVKDYYRIQFKDAAKKEYWYNGSWQPTQLRIEEINVKGSLTIYDTVAYTHFGPVMFDESFSDEWTQKENLAVRWIAHDASNDGYTFYLLNRAGNYNEYNEAIKNMQCPAQNFVFASATGDIAIWQQGKFPARWNGQGLAIMPGSDSSYQWQGYIPQNENPHSLNPARGYLQSANQRPVDSAYHYFIPGSYITPRGVTIDHALSKMTNITPEAMMKLQNNYYNTQAHDILPLLFKYLDQSKISAVGKNYLKDILQWNYEADPASHGQTIYQLWWQQLGDTIWQDDLSMIKPSPTVPNTQVLIELLLKDSTAMPFIDDVRTPEKETLGDVVTGSFNKAVTQLAALEEKDKLSWAQYKSPTIYHLLKDALMPFARTGLNVGGNGNIINATTHSHGPSWRMIVDMTQPVIAFGVYPGGQDGNPGSFHYDDFVDMWASGEYYQLWLMRKEEAGDRRIKWTMKFSKG